ncbi:MAG: ribose 5-phosphate isomerase B, partial [Balneolaceae bacterium]
MKIPIASDHAGYPAKEIIKKLLEEMGHTPVDFGTHSEESVDYPEYSHEVSQRVRDGEFETGILVCGSGQGVCMTANKYEGIRAALVYNEQVAERSRSHNDANVLCLPGRELDDTQLAAILKAWLDTPFEGGRHQRRVEKIH